jgi:hypothetical protein
MAIPVIEHHVLDTPGDIVARPHANCYWVIPGRLLAGEHPGAVVAAEGIARVDALLDAGVRQFIDLTTEHEGPGPYVAVLFERAAARGISVAHRRFAIVDFGVPSPELMRGTLDAIYAAIDAGETLYLHCWGGVGRTGTVVGCLLREQGLDAKAALGMIERKWRSMEKRTRHPNSPETPGQVALIERWPGDWRGRAGTPLWRPGSL